MTNTILKIEGEEDVVPSLTSNVKVTIENGKDNCSSGSDDQNNKRRGNISKRMCQNNQTSCK